VFLLGQTGLEKDIRSGAAPPLVKSCEPLFENAAALCKFVFGRPSLTASQHAPSVPIPAFPCPSFFRKTLTKPIREDYLSARPAAHPAHLTLTEGLRLREA